ncbi:unnamed protein product, partial [Cladocopium goreaui]
MSESAASSPDYEQDWDEMERRSMEVLEKSVEAMEEEPTAASSGAFSAGTLPALPAAGLPEHMRLMQEACSRDPYRPEDHQFTSEEMWAGFSSAEEDAEEDPKSQAVEVRPTQQPQSRAKSSAAGAKELEMMDGAQQRLHRVCFQEPYRPEDHQLTVDEFWGGMDEDTPAEEGRSEPPPKTRKLQTPDGMAEADVRLQRMLAGADAPKALSTLDFQELSDVASDCLKAAETLRWVLERQHYVINQEFSSKK